MLPLLREAQFRARCICIDPELNHAKGRKMCRLAQLCTSTTFFCIAFAACGQEIYRCTENGKTTFSDKPCASKDRKSTEPATADERVSSNAAVSSANLTPYGEWRGQTQFQASAKGQRITEAHSVVPMTIAIDRQGKVTGASPENGCRLLGIAAPGTISTILHMDVSLSGCEYAAYNRRFAGMLALYLRDKHVQLSLTSVAPLASQYFDIRATMRR